MLTSGWIVAIAAALCWFWQTRKTARSETLAQYWQNQVRSWAEDAELVRSRLVADKAEAQVAELTRERDEARAERDAADRVLEFVHNQTQGQQS